MNSQQIENKVRQDTIQLKKDLGTMVGDGKTQIKNFGGKMNHSATQVEEDVNSWIENGISNMNTGFGNLSDDAKAAINEAAAKLKKNTDQSFKLYNTKLQEVADSVPGGFSKKLTQYPWVTLSAALICGLVLGSFIRLARRLM